jgi:hypothetical protein
MSERPGVSFSPAISIPPTGLPDIVFRKTLSEIGCIGIAFAKGGISGKKPRKNLFFVALGREDDIIPIAVSSPLVPTVFERQ